MHLRCSSQLGVVGVDIASDEHAGRGCTDVVREGGVRNLKTGVQATGHTQQRWRLVSDEVAAARLHHQTNQLYGASART